MKEFVQTVLVIIIMSATILGIMFSWALEEPTGHYEGTYNIQPDGTYYTWIEE